MTAPEADEARRQLVRAYCDGLTREQRLSLLGYVLGYLSGVGHLHAALAGAATAGIIPPAES